MSDTAPLLQIEDLTVDFNARRFFGGSTFRAVDGVSFSVGVGETLGLVGESGSGKTTIGRVILGLQAASAGSVRVAGEDVTERTVALQRRLASQIQAVFQDPFSSLNPARTVGRTLTEPLEIEGRLKPAAARAEIERLLAEVGLPSDAADRFPHSFSGGQRQRIAVARALATKPRLVVCDEPVSALDLVTRAQVLNLLADLQRQNGISYLLIAHDLPIVTHMAQRVVVLYRGRVMEQGPAEVLERDPLHPYTQALIAAAPVIDPRAQRERRQARGKTVKTTTANAKPPPVEGCPFAPRCPHAEEICWSARPADTPVAGRTIACHLFDPAAGHPGAQGRSQPADPAPNP